MGDHHIPFELTSDVSIGVTFRMPRSPHFHCKIKIENEGKWLAVWIIICEKTCRFLSIYMHGAHYRKGPPDSIGKSHK